MQIKQAVVRLARIASVFGVHCRQIANLFFTFCEKNVWCSIWGSSVFGQTSLHFRHYR